MAQLKTKAEAGSVQNAEAIVAPNLKAMTALREARRHGLLDGEKSEHVSFRAPKALVEAARRHSGAKGMTEIGTLALALLAQEDPVQEFMRRTRGVLGPDHELEY